MGLVLTKRKIIAKFWLLEVILSYLLFALFTNSLFHVGFRNQMLFFLFQIFGILIPGYACVINLDLEMTYIERAIFSYSIGYALNILEYYAEELVGRRIHYLVFQLAVCVVSIIVIWKKRVVVKRHIRADKSNSDDKSKECVETIIIATSIFVLLMLNIFVFAYYYNNPFKITHDMEMWINNSVALKLNYPPENTFMAGTRLYYHYFSSIQIAYSSLVTGIDVVSLSIPLYTMTKTLIMCGAVFFALNVLGIRGYEKILGSTIVLYATGLEKATLVTYYSHILKLPFGFDIGFAFGIIFIALILIQHKKENFDCTVFFLTVISWMVCVGAKAPVAAVLIVFPALVCLDWFVRKRYRMAMLYGGAIVSVFLVISICCVGMLSVAKGDSSAYYLALHSINDLQVFNGKQYNIATAILLKWIGMNPTIAILMILFGIEYILTLKRAGSHVERIIFYLIITYLWGLLLWQLISADGCSEMYYAMAAYIPAYFLVAIFYCSVIMSNANTRLMARKIVVILSCLVGLYFFMVAPYGGDGALEAFVDSAKAFETISNENTSDMDALRWLRDYTHRDSLVLADDAVISGDDRFYYYGMVSERLQYLEGTYMLRFGGEDIINEIERRKGLAIRLYNNDYSVIESLKVDGVDYVVQTRDISPQFYANTEYLELVNSSKNVNVYRIK